MSQINGLVEKNQSFVSEVENMMLRVDGYAALAAVTEKYQKLFATPGSISVNAHVERSAFDEDRDIQAGVGDCSDIDDHQIGLLTSHIDQMQRPIDIPLVVNSHGAPDSEIVVH